MQFTQSISYPGIVDEVVAMYLTPAYLERRFGRFVVEGSTTVSVEGERVSYAGTVRPELIPAAAARFVKSDLRVTFTEEWTLNEAGAVTDADLGAVLVAGDVLTHARTLHVQRFRGITHGTYCVAKRPRPPSNMRWAGGVPRRA